MGMKGRHPQAPTANPVANCQARLIKPRRRQNRGLGGLQLLAKIVGILPYDVSELTFVEMNMRGIASSRQVNNNLHS